MASSLSDLVNNLSEGLHRIKCISERDDKECGIKFKYCDCFLAYTNFKDDSIEYKCSIWNRIYQQMFNEKLKERFFNTYKFSKHDNSKFILLLWKGVYPYKYMDDWEKFSEEIFPEKENFYSQLDMEDITDADYVHAKRIFIKILKLKLQENIMICTFKVIHYC